MKRHSYGKLISMSWNWMTQILFRPFSLKKWIMLGIIILLAGQMGGGFNFNLGGKSGNLDKLKGIFGKKESVSTMEPASSEMAAGVKEISALRNIILSQDVISKLTQFFKDPGTIRLIALLLTPFILFIILIIFLWMWVRANFSFVFIDSIVRNDASLRVPFHRNKPIGNSFFRWSVVYGLIALLIFGIILYFPIMQLISTGTFTAKHPINVTQILSIILSYVPILLVTAVLFALVSVLTGDFVLPIMYKRKICILEAWNIFLGLLRRNIGEILLYLLVKIGLAVLALAAAIVLLLVGIIALIVIGGLIALLGFLFYFITPAEAKGAILAVLILIGIPVYLFLGFLFNLFFIPIQIFFRIFSMQVLGSMDESLDIFAPKTEEEIMLETDDEEYRKPMKLVWFTVLSPLLVVILGLLLAIAMPYFAGRWSKIVQTNGGGLLPFKEIPGIRDFTQSENEPEGEVVTVYLKNGNTFKAVISSESENNIAFKIKGGTVVYPRSDILRIEK